MLLCKYLMQKRRETWSSRPTIWGLWWCDCNWFVIMQFMVTIRTGLQILSTLTYNKCITCHIGAFETQVEARLTYGEIITKLYLWFPSRDVFNLIISTKARMITTIWYISYLSLPFFAETFWLQLDNLVRWITSEDIKLTERAFPSKYLFLWKKRNRTY